MLKSLVTFDETFGGGYKKRSSESVGQLIKPDFIAIERIGGIMKIVTVKHGSVTCLKCYQERKNSFSPVIMERKNHELAKSPFRAYILNSLQFIHTISRGSWQKEKKTESL